ncbi:MAG: SCO family protein [Gammaproteobacteria bacterium]|nr:SCO family protein [Gammaproteobacteria bacterium]
MSRSLLAQEGRRRSHPTVRLVAVLSAVSVLCFGIGFRLQPSLGPVRLAGPPDGAMRLAEARQLEEFHLQDQHGNAFDRAGLTGRWTFLVFGYSRCPDVCPLTLEVLAEALEHLSPPPSAQRLPGLVMVSVDGARDTPEVLARYLDRFDSRIVGLTGDAAQVDRLARSVAVRYAAGRSDPPGRALIDHTALIALIDPQARLTAGFGLPYDAREIAAAFRDIAGWPAEPG